MGATLKEINELAMSETKRRGFRSVGIYHLIWATKELEPETFDSWMQAYQIEFTHFVKMLENVLRPRRAGGGIPRDKLEADLKEQALTLGDKLAKASGQTAAAVHLGEVFSKLSENPISVLCERFSLDYKVP
ncbi:MAG: hypothetical protein JRJ87_09525 [Deltaproteobacteria bacterium]|nr:hypothetical protein [Deltaproteobacteria bacterium]